MTSVPVGSAVRSFHHRRKGPLRLAVIREDDEWITGVLVGDHKVRYFGQLGRGSGATYDGEQITVRKSLMVEVGS